MKKGTMLSVGFVLLAIILVSCASTRHQHNYVNGICVECGSFDYWDQFAVSTDGALFASANSIIPEDVVIPEKLNGKVVKSLKNEAFKDCDSINTVSISEGLVSIGAWAFLNCKNLSSIAIPSSVKEIGAMAFAECKSLVSVVFEGSLEDIPDALFYEDDFLSGIVLPEGVKTIGSLAFKGCHKIESFVIPVTVIRIGDRAFYGSRYLTDVSYEGSKSQWELILKGNELFKDTPVKVIHCSDGDIAI